MLAAVLCLGGCHRGSGAGAGADGGSGPAAPSVTAAGETAADGGYVVDLQKLDRFIVYQQRTLALYAQMLEDLARQDAGSRADADAGAASPAAVARIRKHARAQERLREELELSEQDVRALDEIVSDVISRRAGGEAAQEEETIRQMKALAEELPEEQRPGFEATIAGLEEQQAALRSLDEERRRYGAENVDRVLAREAALTRNWEEAIATFAGMKPKKRRDAGPRDGGVPGSGTRDAGAPGALASDAGVR